MCSTQWNRKSSRLARIAPGYGTAPEGEDPCVLLTRVERLSVAVWTEPQVLNDFWPRRVRAGIVDQLGRQAQVPHHRDAHLHAAPDSRRCPRSSAEVLEALVEDDNRSRESEMEGHGPEPQEGRLDDELASEHARRGSQVIAEHAVHSDGLGSPCRETPS